MKFSAYWYFIQNGSASPLLLLYCGFEDAGKEVLYPSLEIGEFKIPNRDFNDGICRLGWKVIP